MQGSNILKEVVYMLWRAHDTQIVTAIQQPDISSLLPV
jgi:hypothetical protein